MLYSANKQKRGYMTTKEQTEIRTIAEINNLPNVKEAHLQNGQYTVLLAEGWGVVPDADHAFPAWPTSFFHSKTVEGIAHFVRRAVNLTENIEPGVYKFGAPEYVALDSLSVPAFEKFLDGLAGNGMTCEFHNDADGARFEVT